MITAICSAIAAIVVASTSIAIAVRRSKKKKKADKEKIGEALKDTSNAIKEIAKVAKAIKK